MSLRSALLLLLLLFLSFVDSSQALQVFHGHGLPTPLRLRIVSSHPPKLLACHLFFSIIPSISFALPRTLMAPFLPSSPWRALYRDLILRLCFHLSGHRYIFLTVRFNLADLRISIPLPPQFLHVLSLLDPDQRIVVLSPSSSGSQLLLLGDGVCSGKLRPLQICIRSTVIAGARELSYSLDLCFILLHRFFPPLLETSFFLS